MGLHRRRRRFLIVKSEDSGEEGGRLDLEVEGWELFSMVEQATMVDMLLGKLLRYDLDSVEEEGGEGVGDD